MKQDKQHLRGRAAQAPWEGSAPPQPVSSHPHALYESTLAPPQRLSDPPPSIKVSQPPARQPNVSSPPRRVPSLYPTSPPTTQRPSHINTQSAKPVAHSLRPKFAPLTLEALKEQRHSEALARESLVEQTLYDLFEVPPTVSEDELRRAYKRVWACFHPDHYASYGIYSRAQLEAQLDQIKTAFELLVDPEQRRLYDLKTFPEGLPQRMTSAEVSPRLSTNLQSLVPKREARAHWSSTTPPEKTGAALKELRERFNLPLSVLHERSKISVSMLEIIEADDFIKMPAEVYLRGFIKELLHIYGVNNLVDLDSYFKVYRTTRAQAHLS